ncbi:hypothetical protein G7Y89_g3367 [Cudoniella acicularis]|uniref:Heterokaryon incompatibility domain-containing protein n=1 Tax=Cudoniella acicularis TaxID=354080 RepID=A0A8H4W8G3_9HELO|nr:hypothetical protein G7Y89_g3367 [Cudoniella acicularis]
MFTLLSTNIESLREGLPLEKLTKTFRDSLAVTRALGIDYIWIDSLCIIQDSREDWARESKVMGEVYKRACCNIAATGFKDGLHGIFVERDRRVISPIKIRSERDSKNIKSGHYYILDTAMWNESVVDAPLNERAWVFQERLLSPRIIHFTGKQLFWECKQKQACEAYPGGIPLSEWSEKMDDRSGRVSQSLRYKQLSPIDNSQLLEAYKNHSSGEIEDAIWDFWNMTVRNFTSFRLTRGSDKLIALSGVANDMKQFFKYEYLAGIWEKNLAHQLLWQKQNLPKLLNGEVSRGNLPRPQEYRAPSWSWACLDSPIIHRKRRPEDIVMVKLLDAKVVMGSGEMANQVIRGYFRMCGKLTRASWLARVEGATYYGGVNLHAQSTLGPYNVQTTIRINPDCIQEWDIRWHRQTLLLKESKEARNCVNRGGAAPNDVFLLPVLVREIDTSYLEKPEKCASIEGLVLEPTGLRAGQFKRVGLFSIETPSMIWPEGQPQRNQTSKSPSTDIGTDFYDLVPALEHEHYVSLEGEADDRGLALQTSSGFVSFGSSISWLHYNTQNAKLAIAARAIHVAFFDKCADILGPNDGRGLYDDPQGLESYVRFLLISNGELFSTDRSALVVKASAPAWLQRQRLLLELIYHNMPMNLYRPFICFSQPSHNCTPLAEQNAIPCIQEYSARDVSSILSSSKPDLEPYEDIYKHLHEYPGLSLQEHLAAETAAKHLRALDGFDVRTNIGGTGLIGILKNGNGKTILLRADTDALPVEELTGLPYASKKREVDVEDGTEHPVMHACGHDMHVACMLAAAQTLHTAQKHWKGTLIILFQPNEERAGGAKAMIADGLYDPKKHACPIPDVVLGQHVMPLKSGTVGTRVGAFASAADSFRVTIYGRGGHASQPHMTIDPVVMAAHIIVRLQTVVSREVNPRDSAVVTVGSVQAGKTENIIASEATIKINVRTVLPETRTRVLTAIKRIVKAECEASGAPKEPLWEATSAFPFTINDTDVTNHVAEAFTKHFGDEHDSESPPLGGSEDFSILATEAPNKNGGKGVPYTYWNFGGVGPKEFEDAKKSGKWEDIPINHSAYFAPVIQPTMTIGVDALVPRDIQTRLHLLLPPDYSKDHRKFRPSNNDHMKLRFDHLRRCKKGRISKERWCRSTTVLRSRIPIIQATSKSLSGSFEGYSKAFRNYDTSSEITPMITSSDLLDSQTVNPSLLLLDGSSLSSNQDTRSNDITSAPADRLPDHQGQRSRMITSMDLLNSQMVNPSLLLLDGSSLPSNQDTGYNDITSAPVDRLPDHQGQRSRMNPGQQSPRLSSYPKEAKNRISRLRGLEKKLANKYSESDLKHISSVLRFSSSNSWRSSLSSLSSRASSLFSKFFNQDAFVIESDSSISRKDLSPMTQGAAISRETGPNALFGSQVYEESMIQPVAKIPRYHDISPLNRWCCVSMLNSLEDKSCEKCGFFPEHRCAVWMRNPTYTNPSRVNMVDFYGNTPLHCAAASVERGFRVDRFLEDTNHKVLDATHDDVLRALVVPFCGSCSSFAYFEPSLSNRNLASSWIRLKRRPWCVTSIDVAGDTPLTSLLKYWRLPDECPLEEDPETASYSDLRDIVEDMITLGVEIHMRDRSGDTALAIAARRGHRAVTVLLLEKGANIHSRNYHRVGILSQLEQLMNANTQNVVFWALLWSCHVVLTDAGAKYSPTDYDEWMLPLLRRLDAQRQTATQSLTFPKPPSPGVISFPQNDNK